QHRPGQQRRKLTWTTRHVQKALAVIAPEELLRHDWTQQSPQVEHITALRRTQSVLPVRVARNVSAATFVAGVRIALVARIGIAFIARVGIALVARIVIAGILRTLP